MCDQSPQCYGWNQRYVAGQDQDGTLPVAKERLRCAYGVAGAALLLLQGVFDPIARSVAAQAGAYAIRLMADHDDHAANTSRTAGPNHMSRHR
jgi:hypothetical protein